MAKKDAKKTPAPTEAELSEEYEEKYEQEKREMQAAFDRAVMRMTGGKPEAADVDEGPAAPTGMSGDPATDPTEYQYEADEEELKGDETTEPEAAPPPCRKQTITEDCGDIAEMLRDADDVIRKTHRAVGALKEKCLQSEQRTRALLELVRNYEEFTHAVGFGMDQTGKLHTKRMKKCPYCNHAPYLTKAYEDGRDSKRWAVICANCFTRTASADGPMAAIKNWNDGKETDTSRMLNEAISRRS